MIHRRIEGQMFRYGFNYTWKDQNTLFALYLMIPIFVIPPHLYHDFDTNTNVYGKLIIVWRFGFRLRMHRKSAWETLRQRLLFRSEIWFKPFGKSKKIK